MREKGEKLLKRRSSILSSSLLRKHTQGSRIRIGPQALSLGPLGWPQEVFS